MWPRAQKSGRLQQLAGPGNGVSPPGPPGGRGPAGASLSAPRGRPRTSAFRNRRVTNMRCGKSELAAQAQSSAGARSGCSPRRHLLGRSWHLTDRKTGPLEGRVRGVGWARRPVSLRHAVPSPSPRSASQHQRQMGCSRPFHCKAWRDQAACPSQ